jgi:hypothetical protein
MLLSSCNITVMLLYTVTHSWQIHKLRLHEPAAYLCNCARLLGWCLLPPPAGLLLLLPTQSIQRSEAEHKPTGAKQKVIE